MLRDEARITRPAPGGERVVVALGQTGLQRCRADVLRPADTPGVAAVEDHHDLAGGDRAERGGELLAGDRGGGERLIRGVHRVDGQQVLAGVRAGLDAPTVAGEVDEHGGVVARCLRQVVERRDERGAGCRCVQQQSDVAGG